MSYIFDSHAHYDDSRFDPDRHEIISGLPEKGVGAIINVAYDISSSEKSIALSNRYDFLKACVGIHPHDADKTQDNYIEKLTDLISHPNVVGLGEMGLDYHFNHDHNKQIEVFISQLDLAAKLNMPVIIHSRDAAKDTLDILKQRDLKGVVHCFSGSLEMAKIVLDKGYYIGVGGVITFKNAKTLKEVVKSIDIHNILLETDCPYLAPEPFRGKRCDSSMIKYVAEEIAKIKGISYLEVIEKTNQNAKQLFNL